MQSSNDSFSSEPYIPDADTFDLGLVAPQLLPHLWLPPIEDFNTFSAGPSIFSFVEDTGPALPMPAPYPFPCPFPLPMPQTNPHIFPVDRFLPVVAPFTTNREVLLVEAASPQGQNLRSVAPTPTTPARKARRVQRRRRMNGEEERIAFLKNDNNIESFTESRATCLACGKQIKLDTRDGARYYVGAWVRHKGCCKAIKKRNEAGCRQESTAADERRTNF